MTERTPTDYALEFAEYMAKGAEQLIEAVNALAMAEQARDEGDGDELDAKVNEAQQDCTEFLTGLRNDIHQFRTRRDRAARAAQSSTVGEREAFEAWLETLMDPDPRANCCIETATELRGDGHYVMSETRIAWDAWQARAALAPAAQAEPTALPHPGSPEASAMIDSVLAEYKWPSNAKNAARAGYVAARRLMQWARKPLPAFDDLPAAQAETVAFSGATFIQHVQSVADGGHSWADEWLKWYSPGKWLSEERACAVFLGKKMEPMDMALCESQSLVLREGQTYRFRRVGECATCAAMSAASREAYGEPPAADVDHKLHLSNPPAQGTGTATSPAQARSEALEEAANLCREEMHRRLRAEAALGRSAGSIAASACEDAIRALKDLPVTGHATQTGAKEA